MNLLRAHTLILLLTSMLVFGCKTNREPGPNDTRTITFKHGKILGDSKELSNLLLEFEHQHNNVRIIDEELPSGSDEQHQYYVINLQGRSSDIDVFAMDVIWVQEFARAGWLEPLEDELLPTEQKDFFNSTIEAATFRGHLFAIPWYMDAGVMYYRKDLLERYDFRPPQTWNELVSIAKAIKKQEGGELLGFVWQGKEYEGLICNVLEYLWASGGALLENGANVVDSEENEAALNFIQQLIFRDKITPQFVSTLTEEPSRNIFQQGRAIFMRNWPYAWRLLNSEKSPVRGKVGLATLPTFGGRPSASTLGGWQLGINQHSKNIRLAKELVLFLTSKSSQKRLARTIGYQPTRVSLYMDSELQAEQPNLNAFYRNFSLARSRPVSPYYIMISQLLQPEFSAVVTGLKTPKEALLASKQKIDLVLGVGQ